MNKFAAVVTLRDGNQEMVFVNAASDDAVRLYLTRGNPPPPYEGFETIEKIFPIPTLPEREPHVFVEPHGGIECRSRNELCKACELTYEAGNHAQA